MLQVCSKAKSKLEELLKCCGIRGATDFFEVCIVYENCLQYFLLKSIQEREECCIPCSAVTVQAKKTST